MKRVYVFNQISPVKAVDNILGILQEPKLRVWWYSAWEDLVCPDVTQEGCLNLLHQGYQTAIQSADEQKLCSWYKILEAWLSTQDEDKQTIIGLGCKEIADEIANTVRAYLLCGYVAFWAERLKVSSSEQVAMALLDAAWKTLQFSGQLRATEPFEIQTNWQELARELLRSTSNSDCAPSLVEKAFGFLCQHFPSMQVAHVAFLRELTTYIINPSQGRKPNTRITVPFPLVEQTPQGERAVLAQFVFERLPEGHGDVFLTPEQAFLPMDKQFRRVLTEIPLAVHRMLERENVVLHSSDVRVRLEWLTPEAQLIHTPLTGNSASGAAAWGLYLIWTDKVPDDGIIVMAQVDHSGSLSGVDGIKVKVEAAVAHGHFDTIIVASLTNLHEAEETITLLDKLSSNGEAQGAVWDQGDSLRPLDRVAPLRVVIPHLNTLPELVKVRSRLAELVITLLHQSAEELDTTPWVRKDGVRLRASDIVAEPFVLMKEESSQALHLLQVAEEQPEYVQWAPPIAGALYGSPARRYRGEGGHWWQMLRRGVARLGVQGGPGSGKTFITKYTVAKWARHVAEQLEQQKVGIETVEVPIWLTAKALMQTSAMKVDEMLLEVLKSGLGSLLLSLSPPLCKWLQRAMSSSRACVVVDALDEIPESRRTAFQAKIKQLDRLPGQVIITCRTMQWEERRSWLGWRTILEMELAPLQRWQQQEFGRKFFKGNSGLAESMTRLLNVNVALRHACATPLLLTFVCLLHEKNTVDKNTTYGLLYAHVLRKMISGGSRIQPPWVGNPLKEDRCLKLLDSIGWKLFTEVSHLNRFTLDNWKHAARESRVDPEAFLDQLVEVGFIVPAGHSQQGHSCWSIEHSTFLEFLAARALSDCPDWLNEAKAHFWFDPEWLEVLTFLAGLIDDVTPLIEAVAQEEEDLFGSMLYLKARLVGAAAKINERLVRQVCKDVFSFWYDTLSFWRSCLHEFSFSMLVALSVNPLARSILANDILHLIRHKERWMRVAAVEALGWLGAEQVINRLLELTHETDQWIRRAAAEALGKLGTEQAINRLLELTHETDQGIRQAAAEALGKLGTEQAINRLLELTWDRTKAVRQAAAEALGKLGTEQAIDRLLELTRDKKGTVCQAAAKALGHLGAEQAIDRLLELTHETDQGIRQAAAEALGKLGTEQAIDRLLELTRDKKGTVCQAAAKALGHLGAEQAIDRLLELTHEDDVFVRQAAAEALGKLGAKRAADQLTTLIYDQYVPVSRTAIEALSNLSSEWTSFFELTRIHKDWWVRQVAVQALGRLGDKQIKNELLELRRDQDGMVRRAAVMALWQIAWKNKLRISPDLYPDSSEILGAMAARSSVAER